MKKCAVLLVAGGSGERFGGPKQFALLDGKPVLQHALEVFLELEIVSQVVVVLPEKAIHSREWNMIMADLGNPRLDVAVGGATRRDSVHEGLKVLPNTTEYVAVHDGVRPFVPVESLQACLLMLATDSNISGAIVASPCPETLKRVHLPERRMIAATLNREEFVRAQTPQVCRYKELLSALELARGKRVTDEAQVLELAGMRTAAVVDQGWNPKITYPIDLELAEAYIQRQKLLKAAAR
ncbi:MAG: 2-C-methyl-D-erythritol 4-phosphate cytidylyltransferase [Candidatus Sumerlaeia bacterium]|nr:2-C-methyl-D-erythritol 4-phosphate cytidylyltransferase [Candidatus Sumerlaeia bacterium]